MSRKEPSGKTRIVQGIVKRRGPSPHGALLLAAAALAAAALFRPTLAAPIEDALARLALVTLGHREPAPEIVIIGIDERSLREVGGWPWSRGQLLGLLERLRSLGAGLVAVDGAVAADVGLAEARLPARRDGGPDFTVGFAFYPTLGEMPPEASGEALDRDLKEAEDHLAFPSTPADDAPLPAMAGIRINRFSSADHLYLREGFSNLFPDGDGTVRRQPLAARLRHRVYPAFALAAATQWRGFTPILAQDAEGRPAGALIGEERIRTGADAVMTIRYAGPEGSFARRCAAAILAGEIPQEEIDSRLLLVGLTAPALRAAHATPVGPMSDVEISANAIDNLLLSRALTEPMDRRMLALAILALGLLFAFGLTRLSPRFQAITAAAAAFLVLAAGVLLQAFVGIGLPAGRVALAILLLSAVLFAWRIIRVESPRRTMRGLWRGRIAPRGIDAAAADPALISGPGRAVAVTALACDIKGYAALVDGLSPTQLAEFLKEYRSLIAQAVMEEEGFIDSWAGDECRAVFGTPAKATNHALAAVRAAAVMRRSIAARRDEFERRFGALRFRIGIGIHTGTAAAGDVGAGGAIGFGVVGGAIEAACLLRNLNRTYRTATLASEPTKVQTDGAFSYRPLDPVLLTGERTPCFIHELVGETGTILPQLAGFLAARDAYLHGDFARAARLLGELLKKHPHDGPSQLLLRRSLFLSENPPDWKWNGLWRTR